MEETIAQLLNLEDFGRFPNVSVMELDKLPRCAAVYFLYFPLDHPRYPNELRYIGKSKCLRARWQQKGSHGVLFSRQRISWVELPVESLDEIEKRLILAYQPSGNLQHCPRNHRRNFRQRR
jgi:hypothetical protein